MRKRIIGLFLALLACMTATGMAAGEEPTQSNILIVYFSRHGSSFGSDDADAVSSASLLPEDAIVIANMIAELTGGDRFQIVTMNPYPKDYNKTTDVAMDEQTASARPELAGQIENLDGYDTIVLGYPNWWGTIPMSVATYLETYDLSGKTILPYCTHKGSRLGRSMAVGTGCAGIRKL